MGETTVILIWATAGTAVLFVAAGVLCRWRLSKRRKSLRHSRPADCRGPLTASRALEVVEFHLRRLRVPARDLAMISAGEHITPDGASVAWEFIFADPASSTRTLVSLGPHPLGWEDPAPELQLTITLHHGAARSHERRLPRRFVDSPQATRSMEADGLDWQAQATPTALSTAFDEHGRACWQAESDGSIYRVPLAGEDRKDHESDAHGEKQLKLTADYANQAPRRSRTAS